MKISALTPVSSVDGTELSPCNQSSTTVRTTLQAIANLFKGTRGTAIASASSINLGAATGSNLHITGTTTITSLGTVAAGVERRVIFDGALTLTHNATSLVLPGNANITTAAGDSAVFISEGSGNWRCVSYNKADGTSVGAATIANDSVTYAKMQNVSATQRVIGRNTAGSGDPEEVTLTQLLDWIGSAAQGDLLYRDSSSWARLAAGTSGKILRTNGASANPSWYGGVVSLTDGATISVDASLGDNFRVTLGGNRTLANPTNLVNGQVLNFRIAQDGTGSRTLSYGTKYKFPGGTTPILTTTASAHDFMSCQYDSTDDTLYCVLNKDFK
jgi:hypothetical protein